MVRAKSSNIQISLLSSKVFEKEIEKKLILENICRDFSALRKVSSNGMEWNS